MEPESGRKLSGMTESGEETYEVSSVTLNNVALISLIVSGEERVCLAQLSNTLLKDYSYNEIHNRRVALGITCVQCTPLQLEVLRRSGAMPMSSRRCGMITRREAERLYKSFFNEIAPPNLPTDFVFSIYHQCGWGCNGYFIPSRYNSSRAKCIRCAHCSVMFSPNKFIFHCHQTPSSTYIHPDAANFNSWRRHIKLTTQRSKEIEYAWEDVKALFNGGSRKRVAPCSPGGVDEGPPPNKIQNMVFNSIQDKTTPSINDSPSKDIIDSGFQVSTNGGNFPTFSGLAHPFLRASAAAGAFAPPVWSPSHQMAFNEFLNRTRLIGVGWSHPTLPGYAHLNRLSIQFPPTRAINSQNEKGLELFSQVNITGINRNERREQNIKRPWLDSKEGDPVKLSDSNTDISIIHPILSRDARTALAKSPYPKTSHTEPLVKTDNQAQDLLKAFLSRVEHRVF